MNEEVIVRDSAKITMGTIIPGEGTDVKITYKGRDYRIKRRVVESIKHTSLASTQEQQAPLEFAVDISIALLTPKGKVAQHEGEWVTFPTHRIVLGSDLPGYNPEVAFFCALEDQLEAAHNRLEGHNKLTKLIENITKGNME